MKRLLRHFDEKTHIIWDWNGTLLDDVDLCVSTVSELLRRYNLPGTTREAYRRDFCFPVIEYYRTLGFDLDRVPFTVVANEFMTLYREQVSHCPLYPGTRELLSELKSEGKTLAILSAAYENDLRMQLRHHGIEGYFDFVCGIGDHYAAGKIERGEELLAQLPESRSSVVMVGDTDHDVHVADALGIDLILLADGHQSYERLRSQQVRRLIPDRLNPVQ